MTLFDVDEFQRLLDAEPLSLGNPLYYSQELSSTNDAAKQAAKAGATHGTLFIADSQTAGRGRHGKTWLSNAGDGLLFSIVLRPGRVAGMSALTLAAGLGVLHGLAGFPPCPLKLKWPNDIYAEDRKLAGILVETELSDNPAIIMGVGINVNTPQFPPELADLATSLKLLGQTSPRERVLVSVLKALEIWLARFLEQGVEGLHEELTDLDFLKGKQVQVEELRGIGAGIDRQGRLLLRDSSEKLHSVGSGTVVLISGAADGERQS